MVPTRLFSALFTLLVAVTVSAQRVELLDFYLPTCAPCRAMAPVVDQLAAQGVVVHKIDGSRDPELAARMRVESYPTFIAVVDGHEVGRVVGATGFEQLRELIAGAANPALGAVTRLAASTSTFAAPPGGERSFAVGGDLGPGAPAPRPEPSVATDSAAQRLLAATVRLTIDDPAGRAFGTGTIVDSRQGEALVVTCAHLFRDASGQPLATEGIVSVEVYTADEGGVRVVERVAGTVVATDFEGDVALVAIRPTGEVSVASVAASAEGLRAGDPVRSAGCDLGADPTVRQSRVVSLNRYNGAPNIETTGAPVQGRSGGGLFNEEGELVGVCFASDEPADEGLYSGLASIHAQLDRVGLAALYRGVPAAAVVAAADPSAPAATPSAEPPAELTPVVRGQSPETPAWPAASARDPFATADATSVASAPDPSAELPPVERATLDEVVRRGEDAEVVLLIRPKTPGAATEVMTLDSASPGFVAALRRLGSQGVALQPLGVGAVR